MGLRGNKSTSSRRFTPSSSGDPPRGWSPGVGRARCTRNPAGPDYHLGTNFHHGAVLRRSSWVGGSWASLAGRRSPRGSCWGVGAILRLDGGGFQGGIVPGIDKIIIYLDRAVPDPSGPSARAHGSQGRDGETLTHMAGIHRNSIRRRPGANMTPDGDLPRSSVLDSGRIWLAPNRGQSLNPDLLQRFRDSLGNLSRSGAFNNPVRAAGVPCPRPCRLSQGAGHRLRIPRSDVQSC